MQHSPEDLFPCRAKEIEHISHLIPQSGVLLRLGSYITQYQRGVTNQLTV